MQRADVAINEDVRWLHVQLLADALANPDCVGAVLTPLAGFRLATLLDAWLFRRPRLTLEFLLDRHQVGTFPRAHTTEFVNGSNAFASQTRRRDGQARPRSDLGFLRRSSTLNRSRRITATAERYHGGTERSRACCFGPALHVACVVTELVSATISTCLKYRKKAHQRWASNKNYDSTSVIKDNAQAYIRNLM